MMLRTKEENNPPLPLLVYQTRATSSVEILIQPHTNLHSQDGGGGPSHTINLHTHSQRVCV